MKTIYLTLAAIAWWHNTSAQSLSVYNPNNNLQDTAGFYIIEGTVDVVNISSSTKLFAIVRVTTDDEIVTFLPIPASHKPSSLHSL